jgi:hypothetical protein
MTISRRHVTVGGLGLVASAPLSTSAYASSPLPNVGILIAATDAPDVWAPYIENFTTTLNGLMSGTAVNYDQRPIQPTPPSGKPPPKGAGGADYNTYYAAAQTLINDGVSIIVTAGNLAAQACKDAVIEKATQTNATNPIPIVVASAGDLTELADGNLTGCTNGQQNLDILKERIRRMGQLNPPPTAVGIVGNDTVPPVAWAMHEAFGWIPQILNVQAYLVPFRQPSDLQDPSTIRKTLDTLPRGVNTLYVCSDPLMRTHGHDFVGAAHGQPQFNTMHEFGEWVTLHYGDLAYGPDFTTLFQKAAGFVYQYFQNGVPLPTGFNPQVTDCKLTVPPTP